MIQAYCSKCSKDLGVLPRPVCSKDMICGGCFRDISKEGIKEEIEEWKQKNSEPGLSSIIKQESSE